MKLFNVTFWLVVIVIITTIISAGLGLWKLFELIGLIPFLIFIGIFVTLLISTCVCLYFLISKIKYTIEDIVSKAKEFIADLKEKLQSLSVKDIVKIVLQILKKQK